MALKEMCKIILQEETMPQEKAMTQEGIPQEKEAQMQIVPQYPANGFYQGMYQQPVDFRMQQTLSYMA